MESVSNSKKTYGQVFAERLTILCKERGFYSDNSIMQNDLAAELGASPSTINRYATGMRLPDPMYLIKFSEFFHVSVDWLLGLVDERYGIVYPQYYREQDKNRVDPEGISPEQGKLLRLFERASDNDKQIIQIILNKYKVE